MSRYFRVAPYDTSVFISTMVFILVLGFFSIRALLAVLDNRDPDNFDLGASVILSVLIVFGWLRSVKGYSLGQGALTVVSRGPGRLRIPMESIVSAEARPGLGLFMRSGFFSIQGLFGFAGTVNVRKSGDVKANYMEVYGTNPANTVVVQLRDDRTIILTPRDAPGFVQALREAGVANQTAKPSPGSKKKAAKR
jgi:hypothetical protein